MLRILIINLLFFASLFSTLQLQAQVTHVPMQAEIGSSDHQQLAEDFYTAMIGQDYASVQSMLAPDFTYYASGGDSLNAEGLIGMWKGYEETSHNSQAVIFSSSMNVPQGPFMGEYVLAWLQASWIDNATGQETGAWIHEIIKINDGKIELMYNYQDNLSIVLQSGFTLTPPASASAEK